MVELSPPSLALPDLPQHLLLSIRYWRSNEMNKALIVYLVNKRKKLARKDVESKHATAELKKQSAATF